MQDWTWSVIYDDGTIVTEDQAGGFGALEIDRIRTLIVSDRNETKADVAVHISEGMRPIFFRRKKNLVINDPTQIPHEYVDHAGNVTPNIVSATVLGWQKTVNGRNVKSLIWLMYDGSVAVTDRDLKEL